MGAAQQLPEIHIGEFVSLSVLEPRSKQAVPKVHTLITIIIFIHGDEEELADDDDGTTRRDSSRNVLNGITYERDCKQCNQEPHPPNRVEDDDNQSSVLSLHGVRVPESFRGGLVVLDV